MGPRNHIEINLSEALAEMRCEIDEEVHAVTDYKHSEIERKRRWLAIKSLQRAEALMREALEIVSC